MDEITAAINRFTAHVVGQRFTLENERMAKMERLKEKLARAAQVAPRATAAIEADADALIAREADITAKRKAAFAPHHALLDSHKRSLDQLEDALQIVGNADPLESSGDESEVAQEQLATFPREAV